MSTYDWIVVGNGFTGSAVSYELAQAGASVLLLDRQATPDSATRFSYGGIAYWSGTTPLMKQLCQEGIDLHRSFADELGHPIDFRELDLLLTIPAACDPQAIASNYAGFAIPPTLLSPDAAVELEPLLDQGAIAGALTIKHGHVSPMKLVQAYNQAFIRAGGTLQIEAVTGLIFHSQGGQVQGVTTTAGAYHAAQVIVCAGGFSRALLQADGLHVPVYFTHAELIETPPVDLQLRTLVMPALQQRFDLEAAAVNPDTDGLWDQPDHEVMPPILDAGAIQFSDGHLCMGQISRVITTPTPTVDAVDSEAQMRSAIGEILPALKDLPGQWHGCPVAFSSDRLPLIGPLAQTTGIHIFSGFGNPFAIMPPLARRFAQSVTGQPDPLLAPLSPQRFAWPKS